MARPKGEDLTKHTLLLHAGDFAKLQAMYPELGASIIIRKLVHKHIERIENAASPAKIEVDL